MDPLWTHMDPFIYVYSYMDPLWTHSYKCIHIGTHYGPIHIRLFIYGPIMDPFIYVYSYMDPLWTHSYKCIHIWTHQGPTHIRLFIYGPIMDPLWTHSRTNNNKNIRRHFGSVSHRVWFPSTTAGKCRATVSVLSLGKGLFSGF